MIAIRPGERVFVLTGAGISAESGLTTFRDPGGLWRQRRPEEVATPEAWSCDPKLVWEFYSERRQRAAAVQPNPAHYALAKLEASLGERLFLCTQNVDPLHERAGSQCVLHMHGELMKSRCDRCLRPPFADEQLYMNRDVPRCPCGGQIRPHVCWFGEIPYEMDTAIERLENSEVFVSIGSSGTVQPAASFAQWAGRQTVARHARTYYVGLEDPVNSWLFDEVFLGKAGEQVPKLFRVEDV